MMRHLLIGPLREISVGLPYLGRETDMDRLLKQRKLGEELVLDLGDGHYLQIQTDAKENSTGEETRVRRGTHPVRGMEGVHRG